MRRQAIVAMALAAGGLSLAVAPTPSPPLPTSGSKLQQRSELIQRDRRVRPAPSASRQVFELTAQIPSPTLPPRENARVVQVTSGRQIAFGLYNPGIPDDMGKVSATEDLVGKHAAILMWYKHWGGAWNNFYAQWVNAVSAHGSVPMITWMSDDYAIPGYPNPAVESTYSNLRILSGAFDDFIRGWADGLKATGRLVLLRFDHEMNGNWYAWAPGFNGNTAANYIAMWRHVHDIFVREGATNVRWVWSPNVDYPGAIAFEAMYPGDAYVDWVALDGYNWGMTNGYTPWRSFSQVFGSSYSRLNRLTQKPLMIAEVGSVEAGAPAGQSKASWIASMLMQELPGLFPRVRAFVWFDQNNGAGQDFRIASSSASASAFARSLQRPSYLSTFEN